jgi:cell division protein FtsQ
MTAVPETGIDPRIRERRIAVQRALGRRRLRVIAVVAGAVCVVGTAFLVLNSPLFDVDAVRVEGAQHVAADDVRRASGIGRRDALLFADTAAAARRVEELPWVADATVRRDWPGTIRIRVVEHAPAVFVRDGDLVVLVAANGRAIARAAHAPPGLVEVRGVRAAPANGELLSPPEAAGIMGELPPALAQRVAAIDVSAADVALVLARGGAVRLGSATDLAAKGAAALAVLERRGDAPFAYVDVATPQTPVVRA